jgi:hypothetical protein
MAPISTYDWINHPICHFVMGNYVITAFAHAITVQQAAMLVHPVFLMHALGAFAAWVAADVISYGVHRIIDSAWYDRTVASRHSGTVYAVIDEHHTKPMNYSSMSDHELVYVSYPAVMPLVIAFYLMDPLFYAYAFYASFRFWLVAQGLMVNHAHMWAHERAHGGRVPAVVRALQDMRVLLRPAQHQPHHKTLNSHFSLYNGVAQLAFDR